MSHIHIFLQELDAYTIPEISTNMSNIGTQLVTTQNIFSQGSRLPMLNSITQAVTAHRTVPCAMSSCRN
jgi:hypothetical protein